MGRTESQHAVVHIDYDEVLDHVGHFGPYQKRVFFLLWFVSAISGLSVVVFAFTAFHPPYRCPVPYCEAEDLASRSYYDDKEAKTFAGYVNKGIPQTSLASPSECGYYGLADHSGVDSCDGYIRAIEEGGANVINETCGASEVIFDDAVRENTLAGHYNMACGDHFLVSIYKSILMVGLLVGSFIFGLVSDRFGRMVGLVLSILTLTLAGIANGYMPTKELYGLMRFLVGAGKQGCFTICFVIAVEYVGRKYTMLVGILIEVPFALGELLLGVEAYFIRDWWTLHMVAFAPWIAIVVLYFMIPESPRWLIATNKHKKAVKVINKVIKASGKTCPPELLEPQPKENSDLDEKIAAREDEPQEEKASIKDLFRTKPICRRTLNMFFQWFSVTMGYYGLSFASTDLAGDKYMNFCLTVSIEIPAYIFCVLVMDCWGRRPILTLCQVVSGLSCLAAAILFLVLDDMPYLAPLQLVLVLLGKFMASACFAIVYVYTAELYPTIIRNTAVGSCSSVARIGGIISLLLGLLKVYWVGLPMLIMGSMATIAGFLAVLFPETVGSKLPETMDEAINIGKKNSHRGLCTCICPKNQEAQA